MTADGNHTAHPYARQARHAMTMLIIGPFIVAVLFAFLRWVPLGTHSMGALLVGGVAMIAVAYSGIRSLPSNDETGWPHEILLVALRAELIAGALLAVSPLAVIALTVLTY